MQHSLAVPVSELCLLISGHWEIFSGLPISLTGRAIPEVETFKDENKNADKQQETLWLLKKCGGMSLRSLGTNKFMSFFSSVVLCSAS